MKNESKNGPSTDNQTLPDLEESIEISLEEVSGGGAFQDRKQIGANNPIEHPELRD